MFVKFLAIVLCVLNVYTTASTFLDVLDCKQFTINGNAIFNTISHCEANTQYRLIADPSYDQTFKKLFTWNNAVDGITGADRIMSLLNSLFYPNAGEDDFMIRRVEHLPNESTRFGATNALGMLRFDIACRCSCWSNQKIENIQIFDIEMQTCYEASFINRLIDYGSTLRISNNHKRVVVLAFLNYTRNDAQNYALSLFYKNENGVPVHKFENGIDTYCIYLPSLMDDIINQRQIIIDGNVIGNIGKEWIKLLSLRHWATKACYSTKYTVPASANDSNIAIQSALNILSSVNDDELMSYIQQEKSANDMLNGAREDGALQCATRIAIALIEKGCDNEFISSITNLKPQYIENLKLQINNNNT